MIINHGHGDIEYTLKMQKHFLLPYFSDDRIYLIQ